MKVKELIALLSEQDLETEVWIARDEEGNGFAKFTGYSDDMYVWDYDEGESRVESLFHMQDLDYYQEDDPDFDPSGFERVFVLWP